MVRLSEIIKIMLRFSCLCFLFVATLTQQLVDIHHNLIEEFDKKFPPQRNRTVYFFTKRCVVHSPAEALAAYKKQLFKQSLKEYQVLVSSPCLGSDSLGNMLGVYFESVACAQAAGLHFMTAAKVWNPKQADQSSDFIDALPSLIAHPSPATAPVSANDLKRLCPCQQSCHEHDSAAWVKHIPAIRLLIRSALQSHLSQLSQTASLSGSGLHTVVSIDDLSSAPLGTTLPLIPDAAIHYRCGDNFIGYYGFVPFRAFVDLIPSDSRTIYILAESRGRKTADRPALAHKCDKVLKQLFEFVHKHFPSADVLVRRGDDLYLDFARLSYSRVTVCSVSTFCLWPAVASNGTAYVPKTPLLASGNTALDLGFRWFSNPPVVLGASYANRQPRDLLAALLA